MNSSPQLDLITIQVSPREARMILTALALRFYVDQAEPLDGGTGTHYRYLGVKVRQQVDRQMGRLV